MTDYVHTHLNREKARLRQKERCDWVVPTLFCADGTQLSVQASSVHYSTPRADSGPWEAVEVWQVCSAKGRQIILPSWSGDHSSPYAYVPVDKVNKFIARHGGLQEE